MERFQVLKVKVKFKFVHVQEEHGIGSYSWNQFENKDDLGFKRKLDAILGMLEAEKILNT